MRNTTGLKGVSRHVPVIRPFTGLQLLKYRVNFALSCADSRVGRREEAGDFGDFGVGLTALRGSEEEE